LEKHERRLYVVDDATAEMVHAALERIGVDVAAARESGSLELITKREAYLRFGASIEIPQFL
jgi:hypothetical protein